MTLYKHKLNDKSSVQGKALSWLVAVANCNNYYNYYSILDIEERRSIIQRYALAVYFSTNGIHHSNDNHHFHLGNIRKRLLDNVYYYYDDYHLLNDDNPFHYSQWAKYGNLNFLTTDTHECQWNYQSEEFYII